MVKLSVDIAGIELKYPLMVSSGPLTRDGRSILKIARQRGVGAVVTKTIYTEPKGMPHPGIAKVNDGLLNIDWSDIGLEKWAVEFRSAVRCGVPLVASVKGKTEEETCNLAETFQDLGAAMIEVPISAKLPLKSLTRLIKAVKNTINIPLVTKFGPDIPDIPLYTRKFQEAGADVLSGINTLGPCLAIDIENARPLLGSKYGFGYLSGPAIRPLALRCIAEAKMNVTIPVLGGGGITSGKEAIEMLMAGASCVHLHTAAMLKGIDIFEKIVDEIDNFMRKKGHSEIREIIGLALKS